MPAKTERPLCRACAKTLRPFRYRDEEWNVGRDGADGKPARWGDYGDNSFCGLRCGHKWAVTMIHFKLSPRDLVGFGKERS